MQKEDQSPKLDISQYCLVEKDGTHIEVHVVNPTEVKSALSTHTVYTVKGKDRIGQFQVTKRYSDFDAVRASMLQREPGCLIPPLPRKKMIGNSDLIFVEVRRQGLEIFSQQVSVLKHLWYSNEFQIFLRQSGDVQKNLKAMGTEKIEETIKRYEGTLVKLNGKVIDTIVLGKVVNFATFLKQTLPLLANYKQTLQSYIQARTTNNDQYGLLLNFLLPEFQRNCLAQYVNHNTDGKFILADSSNEKLAHYIGKLKELFSKTDFQHMYWVLDLEEREIQAFLETYRVIEIHQNKLKELKSKQADLNLDLQKLMSGKQSIIRSFLKKNIENDKKEVEQTLQATKTEIQHYSHMSDLMTLIMGYFQIDRFKQFKCHNYFDCIRNISLLQQEITSLRCELYEHLLENHNLM